MNIEIQPKKVAKKLLAFILFLLCANILTIVSRLYFDHDYVYGLVPLFSFDFEQNIPTLYSSFALIFCGVLLAFIASMRKRQGSSYYSWAGLAIIFIFLAIDESTALHERLETPIRGSLNTSGVLYFAWVIPYAMALLVFVITYFNFLMRLPKKTRNLFVVSGVIFVTGAIGFESLSGWQTELYGRQNLVYSILYTVEELLEMLGIVLFIYALLLYIASQFASLTIIFNTKK